MVESIAWYRHEKTVDAGCIGVEFERRAQEMGATQPEPQSLSEALDADMFKVVADRIVQQSRITPILHCFAVEAIMDGNTIKGIITESKSGRQTILAKRVIDATGHADIAHHAGAPHRKAPKENLLSVTVTFGCSGVDVGRFLDYVKRNPSRLGDWDEIVETTGKEDNRFSPYIEEPFTKAQEAGDIPEDIWLKGTWSSLTLVAGRCVAGDKISHAATRQVMCCAVTGQGAGVAAAVSLKQRVTCRQVDISQVQKSLQRQGVKIA